MKTRLTQGRAESLKLGSGLHFDTSLPGFGIACHKSRKTWIAQRSVKIGSRFATRRVKLGNLDRMDAKEARIAAQKTLAEMAEGRNPSKRDAARAAVHEYEKPETAGEWFERFVKAKQDEPVSGKTMQYFRYAWENLNDVDRLKTLRGVPIADRSLAEIGRNPIFVEDLYREIARVRSRPIANGGIDVFRALYNYASLRDHELPANPARTGRSGIIKRLKPERKAQHHTDHLQPEQLPAFARVVASIANPIRRALWTFFLFSGQRGGQTVVMEWKHVQRNGDSRPDSIWIPKPKGGPKAAFELPLNSSLIEILEYLESLRSEPGYPFDEERHAPWLFPAHSGSGHAHRDVDERAFLPVFGWKEASHRLRRTFNSIAEAINVPEPDMDYLLNHRSGRYLSESYSRPFLKLLQNSSERISAELLRHLGCPLRSILRPGE